MGREDHEVKINAIAKTLDLADMGRSDAVPLHIRAVIYSRSRRLFFIRGWSRTAWCRN